MNFVSKFDGALSFAGVHPKTQTHVDAVQTKAPPDAILVTDADLLFNGDFKRSGADLVISRDDRELVLSDYFKGDKHAPLASPDGAYLTGKIIDALTGYVQMAQADGSTSTAKIIGHVTKLNGNATVIRNGVSIILNNGDNVHQGDVVQCGSNSTLGITFIDGSVFGLGSNAKMVLNEMVYDPNGSTNTSLLSLVQGTISFVAGATAKHGDMKVDTPVATMGIRGTAVLVEIEFEVPQQQTPQSQQSAPPVKFQVLVEPDGTTGSYVLLDRTTLAPLATVNQAGTVTTVSGQGVVSFLASAQLSPEVLKLITEVFSLKFSDNTNPHSNTHFTDTPIPENSFPVKFASGDIGTATVRVVPTENGGGGNTSPPPSTDGHIPGPPDVFASSSQLSERNQLTGSSLIDQASGGISYADVNAGDTPTARTAFQGFAYKNAQHVDITPTLTTAQLAAIANASVPLTVVQDPNQKNYGTAIWNYKVEDGDLDFLAAGETLTLTYTALVDNNFAPNNETGFYNFTVTITGANDAPTIAGPEQAAFITERSDTVDSHCLDTATGAVEFKDVDLADTHTVRITGVSATGTVSGLPAAEDTVLNWLSLGTFVDSTDGVTGSRLWSFSAQDHYFDYLAESESVTLTYTVEITDNNGSTVTQDVAVTVAGTNDAPELAADTSGYGGLHTIFELPNVTNSSLDHTVSGSLSFRDVDLSDTHSVGFSNASFNWQNSHGLSLTSSQINELANATFALTLHDSTGTGYGSIDFTYSASDHYFDFLAEGETLTIEYDVWVTEYSSVLSTQSVTLTLVHVDLPETQPVTITVTGANDAPDAVADTDTGHIVEAGQDAGNNFVPGVGTTAGNVLANDTDVDLTDTHEVVGVSAGSVTEALSGNVGAAIKGIYGTLTLNADGSWTYALDNDDPDTNALPQGAQVSDVFSYTQTDHHGGTATTTLTIGITGTNDAPSIVGETNPPVHGVMVINPISPAIEAAGQNTNTLGLATETFNSKIAGFVSNNGFGTGFFYSSDLGALFTASGNAGIVVGSSSVTAAPFMGPLPGGADTSKYLSIGAGGSETITFADAKNAFGLYWGSVDSYNTIKFYSGTTLVASYTGADISPLLASGNQGSFAANGYVDFVGLPFFNKVVLGSSSNAFEIDNISAGVVPAVHSLLVGNVSGTMSVHDPDIGDTLTGVVTGNATALYNNSSILPNGVNVTDLIKAGNVTFDSVQSSGGTDILHWNYDPHGANLDFLHAGDVLKLSYTARVSDGHGNTGSQQIVITLVGTDNETNLSSFKFVDGTSGNDTFSNIGGGATIFGNGGNDTFVFKPASGSATIADYDPVTDTFTFAWSMFNHNPADVLAATHDDGQGNAVITVNGTDTITLQHVQKAQLSAADFHFV